MDNVIWTCFKNLITESHIRSLDVEIPVTESLDNFLLNRVTGDYLLSRGLTSLPILKAKRFYEQAKERGVHSLYVGYLYVNLHLQDEIFLYEPLLLFPVNITAKNSIWYLTNNNEMNIMLNYKLMYHYFEKNGLDYSCFIKEFKDFSHFGENKMAGILAHLEENNFQIINEHIQYIDKKAGLSIIPSSFFLFRDYEEILSDNKTSFLFESLFNDSLKEKPDINNASPSDLYQISSLNSIQTQAVLAAGISDQLLITGPKGNGKKEAILNIISDNLSKGKNVLLISENKEALLSVYQKLSKISSKVCLLSNNKDDIFKKIKIQLNNKTEKQNDRVLTQIRSKSENLNKKIKALEDLEQVLYKKRSFGLSLQEMYSKAEAIKGREDQRYEAFKIFQGKKIFNKFTYYELIASAARLGESLISNYEEYRNLIEDYPYLLKINTDADIIELEKVYKNKEDITAAFLNIYNNFKAMEDFSYIAMLNLKTNFNVTKQDTLDAAEKILSISKDNLSSQSKNRLVHFVKQKSRKSGKLLKNEIKEKSETLTIYNDLIINYMVIITKLKKILKEDFYIELIEDAFNGLNTSDSLNILFEALGKFNIFKNYSDIIFSLNDLDRLILSYAYENNQPPFDEITLINHMLSFSILSQIKDIESRNIEKKSLFTYLKYNELKDSIYSFKAEKNELTWDYINQIWTNKLLEISDSPEYLSLLEELYKNYYLSVKTLFSTNNRILLTLFPVILASPENVSDILPLEDTFSLIIHMDASQITISKAVPSLFRGNKLVVSGDTMSVTKDNSLINKCMDKYYNIYLNCSYIKEREDILSYQNQNFYKNSLVVCPDLIKQPGIELINIKKAINKIYRIIMDGNSSKMGITVFCEKDKENINKNLVEREIYINKNYIYPAEESYYTDRDTVFIFTSGFSSMDNKYKYNMLNMALSSARRKVYLVYQDNTDPLVNEYISYAANLKKQIRPLTEKKKWLINKLISSGYNISSDLGYPPSIDIGIKDNSGRYILGIIFDKEILYPLSLIRYYESMGWKIYKVWSRDLCQDKASVFNNIIKTAGPFLK